MFPYISAGAIVPIETGPLALPSAPESERQATIRELMPYFLGYGKVELRWASGTLEKYEDAMGWVIRWLGEIPPGRIAQQHILLIKAQCARRNVGPNRIAHILAALKSFLRFCQMAVGLETMDVRQIRLPRIPKREVRFLTPDEIRQYVAAIPLRIESYSSPQNPKRTQSSSFNHFSGMRSRSSLPFRKRSNVPLSFLTTSSTVFTVWCESFRARLTEPLCTSSSLIGEIRRLHSLTLNECTHTSIGLRGNLWLVKR